MHFLYRTWLYGDTHSDRIDELDELGIDAAQAQEAAQDVLQQRVWQHLSTTLLWSQPPFIEVLWSHLTARARRPSCCRPRSHRSFLLRCERLTATLALTTSPHIVKERHLVPETAPTHQRTISSCERATWPLTHVVPPDPGSVYPHGDPPLVSDVFSSCCASD